MPLNCPPGWELFQAPSKPDNLSVDLPDIDLPLTSEVGTNARRTGVYDWSPVQGVLSTQSNCGQRVTVGGEFSITQGSEHSINIGTLFNLPGSGEAVEISGGYSYTWTSGTGTAASIQQEVGGDAYEYLATPVVLSFTVSVSWVQSGFTWAEILWMAASPGHIAQIAHRITDRPLFVRGGLMICRRPCVVPVRSRKR